MNCLCTCGHNVWVHAQDDSCLMCDCECYENAEYKRIVFEELDDNYFMRCRKTESRE